MSRLASVLMLLAAILWVACSPRQAATETPTAPRPTCAAETGTATACPIPGSGVAPPSRGPCPLQGAQSPSGGTTPSRGFHFARGRVPTVRRHRESACYSLSQ